jgi:hypothetical protein
MPRALPPIEGKSGTNISPSVVETVAGFTAGVVSCLAVHPLDLLKNRLQRMRWSMRSVETEGLQFRSQYEVGVETR